MSTAYKKLAPKRFVKVAGDGTPIGPSFFATFPPGSNPAARPSVHGKIPANGAKANAALAAQIPNGVGYWFIGGKKTTDLRWLVVTDWAPSKGEPDLGRGVPMCDLDVFTSFGGAPVVEVKARKVATIKAPAQVPTVAGVTDWVEPDAVTVCDSEPPPDSEQVGISDEVEEWLSRLVHEPKRVYAHAYAAALASGAPMPADPGDAWAAKVRLKLDKLEKVKV